MLYRPRSISRCSNFKVFTSSFNPEVASQLLHFKDLIDLRDDSTSKKFFSTFSLVKLFHGIASDPTAAMTLEDLNVFEMGGQRDDAFKRRETHVRVNLGIPGAPELCSNISEI